MLFGILSIHSVSYFVNGFFSLDHVYYKQLLELENEWTFGCHKRYGISRPAERIRITQFHTSVKVMGCDISTYLQ